MATREFDELQSEAPPAKRARFGGGSDLSAGTMNDHNHDASGTKPSNAAASMDSPMMSPDALKGSTTIPGVIPGLGFLGQLPKADQDSTKIEVEENLHSTESAPSDNTIQTQSLEAGNGSEALLQSSFETHHVSSSSDPGSPMVTAALEALLGAPTPPAIAMDSSIGSTEVPSLAMVEKKASLEELKVDTKPEDTVMEDEQKEGDSTAQATSTSSQNIFDAEQAIRPAEMIDANTENVNADQAEFEVDSSPYESSSDDSSDDSSSSDEDEEGDAYKLLSPEEQARILMEGDGGSDDEGGGNKGAKGAGAQLRTKNEVPEEVIPKPDVTITTEMKIAELGYVEHIVESIALIKAKISGEYKVLETGSVLCLEDRSVIGVVADTLGRVQQPLYSVRFTNPEEITKAGLEIGTRIYYSEQHSTYVFTQSLKAFKGSDASNLHDEEVGDEEVEFSDDEKEMEHKRRLKQKKLEKRGGGGGSRGQRSGDPSGRGGHPLQQQTPYDPSVGLSYDEEDDGPYKPLARPAGFAQTIGQTEAPQESPYSGRNDAQIREPYGRGRGRGDRGDRGRGRGRGGDRGRPNDRGQGRGGFQDRRDDGFAQRPYENRNQNQGYSQPAQGPPMGQNFAPNNYNYNQAPQQQQYSPQQPFAPPFPPAPFFPPQPYQQSYAQAPPAWPNAAPTGAFINPAFFGNQQQPGGQPLWPPPAQMQQSAESQKAFNEAQERLNILRSLGSGRGGAL